MGGSAAARGCEAARQHGSALVSISNNDSIQDGGWRGVYAAYIMLPDSSNTNSRSMAVVQDPARTET